METIGAGERLYLVSFAGGSEVRVRAYNPDAARRTGKDWGWRHRKEISSPVVIGASLIKETKEEREANKPFVTHGNTLTKKITPSGAKFDKSIVTVKDALEFLKANPGTEFFKVSFNGDTFCFFGDEKGREYCENYLNEVTGRFYAAWRKMDGAKLHAELANVERRGRMIPSNDLRWQFARVVDEIRKRISK